MSRLAGRWPQQALVALVATAAVASASAATPAKGLALPAAAPPIAPTALAAAPTADPSPLLTFAGSQHYPPLYNPQALNAQKQALDQATFELAKDPPPDLNCAQTLGAKRFATLFDNLGGAYSNMGDEAKAADAFAKAVECNPRAAFLHTELAAALLEVGRYSDARAETRRQVILGRASFTNYSLMTQLDFIDGHWNQAVENARFAATEAPDDEQATYWQCFLWIAQKRAGTPEPILANRRIPPGWPAPILQSLQRRITEADLVEEVRAESDLHRQREILTEALFYTGQLRLIESRPDEATRYFQAVTNLKVTYFIEHHLAVAELEKLRHHPPGRTGTDLA